MQGHGIDFSQITTAMWPAAQAVKRDQSVFHHTSDMRAHHDARRPCDRPAIVVIIRDPDTTSCRRGADRNHSVVADPPTASRRVRW